MIYGSYTHFLRLIFPVLPRLRQTKTPKLRTLATRLILPHLGNTCKSLAFTQALVSPHRISE